MSLLKTEFPTFIRAKIVFDVAPMRYYSAFSDELQAKKSPVVNYRTNFS